MSGDVSASFTQLLMSLKGVLGLYASAFIGSENKDKSGGGGDKEKEKESPSLDEKQGLKQELAKVDAQLQQNEEFRNDYIREGKGARLEKLQELEKENQALLKKRAELQAKIHDLDSQSEGVDLSKIPPPTNQELEALQNNLQGQTEVMSSLQKVDRQIAETNRMQDSVINGPAPGNKATGKNVAQSLQLIQKEKDRLMAEKNQQQQKLAELKAAENHLLKGRSHEQFYFQGANRRREEIEVELADIEEQKSKIILGDTDGNGEIDVEKLKALDEQKAGLEKELEENAKIIDTVPKPLTQAQVEQLDKLQEQTDKLQTEISANDQSIKELSNQRDEMLRAHSGNSQQPLDTGKLREQQKQIDELRQKNAQLKASVEKCNVEREGILRGRDEKLLRSEYEKEVGNRLKGQNQGKGVATPTQEQDTPQNQQTQSQQKKEETLGNGNTPDLKQEGITKGVGEDDSLNLKQSQEQGQLGVNDKGQTSQKQKSQGQDNGDLKTGNSNKNNRYRSGSVGASLYGENSERRQFGQNRSHSQSHSTSTSVKHR
jgi:hypothetical protein